MFMAERYTSLFRRAVNSALAEPLLKAELKRQFYDTLDVMQTAVKSRFDQDDLHILKAAERFMLNSANKQ
jgi:hypothetical protein